MPNSMTAFGRGTAQTESKSVTVEMKSVNNRFLDVGVKMPRAYSYLEEKVRSVITSAGIKRGKVDVFINIDDIPGCAEDTGYTLDSGLAKSYIAALKKLRDENGLTDDMTLMRVAANRDLFVNEKPEADEEHDWAMILPALNDAVAAFTAAREREGKRLCEDLLMKKKSVADSVAKIKELSEGAAKMQMEKLRARVKSLLEEYSYEPDEQRLLTECAIIADRVAIDEELVRLDSHLQAFEMMLRSKEPVGRNFDFLLQEIGREINTTGSKVNDLEITKIVVAVKGELEKIREQVQNLE